MPYVIQNTEGKYLRRFANRGHWQNQREWVDEINDATIWPKSGQAKAAANFASKSSIGSTMRLQEVRLVCWGYPTEIIAKKPK